MKRLGEKKQVFWENSLSFPQRKNYAGIENVSFIAKTRLTEEKFDRIEYDQLHSFSIEQKSLSHSD